MQPTRVLISATLFACVSLAQAQDDPTPPNVIIVFADDLGTLDANCFGSEDLITPAIDSLAESGVRFTQAYAHTVCCPARAALMTGRHPQRSGVGTWTQSRTHGKKGGNMALEEVTLAEAFHSAGYRTALFGKWHLGSHPDFGPKKQGFDEFFGIRGGFIDNYVHYHLHRDGGHDLFEGTEEVFMRGAYFPDLIADRALAFIEENQANPFFLYFSMNLPHYPEQVEERFTELYPNLPEPRRSYAATVSATDAYLGRILTKLSSLGIRDNTIVLFLSDNGHSEEEYQVKGTFHTSGLPEGHNYGANDGGGNTGKWIGAKGSFLEGGVRTPAVLSFPGGIAERGSRDQVVTAMDWYPTLLELCDIETPDGIALDGKSTVPIVQDPSSESLHTVVHLAWQKGWSIREGVWKLIGNGSYGLNRGRLPKLYLANLEDAEPEATNHAESRPEIVERLQVMHHEWEKEVTPTR